MYVDDKKIDEIREIFDGDYNILNFIDEDELRQKIIELKYDEEKIREWIEEHL